MAPPTVPLTWRNVTAPDSSGALNAFNRAGENLGGAFEGLGGHIKQGASDYADHETEQFIADLNAAPDDATRKQMVADASRAFLKMGQVNEAVTDAEAIDFRRAGEAREVEDQRLKVEKQVDELKTSALARDTSAEALRHKKDINPLLVKQKKGKIEHEEDANTRANAVEEDRVEKHSWLKTKHDQDQAEYTARAKIRKDKIVAEQRGLDDDTAARELSNTFEKHLKEVYATEGTSNFAHAFNEMRETFANNPKLTDRHKAALTTLRGKAIENMTHNAATTEFAQAVKGNEEAGVAYTQAILEAARLPSLTAREAAQKEAKATLKANTTALGTADLTKLAENVLDQGRLTVGDMTEKEANSIMARMLKSSGLDVNKRNIERAVKIALDTAAQTDAIIVKREAESAAVKSQEEARQRDLTTAVNVAITAKRSGIEPVAADIMAAFEGDNKLIDEDERLQKSTVSAGIASMIEKLQKIPKYQVMEKGELVLQIGAFLKDSATINTTGTTELAIRDKSQWSGIIGLDENEIADIGGNGLDRMISQWQKTNGLDTIRDRNVKLDNQIAGVKKRLANAIRQRDSIPKTSPGYRGLDQAVANIQKQIDKLEKSK